MVTQSDESKREFQNEDVHTENTSEQTSAEPESPVTPEDPSVRIVVNPLARIVATISDPSAAMRGVNVKNAWWVALIVMAIAMTIFAFGAGDIIQQFSQSQTLERLNEMADQGRLSQEQVDMIMNNQPQGTAFKWMMMGSGTASQLLMILVQTLLMLLVGNVFLGGNAKFGKYWGVAMWATIIRSLNTILSGIMIMVTNDMQSAQFGLGILTKSDPSALIHKVAATFNIFTIWEAVLLGIGVAIVAGLKNRKPAIIWMLVIYLLMAFAGNFMQGGM